MVFAYAYLNSNRFVIEICAFVVFLLPAWRLRIAASLIPYLPRLFDDPDRLAVDGQCDDHKENHSFD